MFSKGGTQQSFQEKLSEGEEVQEGTTSPFLRILLVASFAHLTLTNKKVPSVLCTMQKLSEIGFCRVKNGCFMGGHFFPQNFSKLNQQQPELLKGAECANDTKFNK